MPSQERIRTRMQELARLIRYEYRDPKHLSLAMYCEKEEGRDNYTNDAMATLGDAVLKLIWAEHFFDQDLDKDEISARKARLESNAALKRISDRVGIYRFAYNNTYFADEAPHNKRLPYGNHDIYLEAIVAAIYRDRGLEYTRSWVLSFWERCSDNAVASHD